MTWSLPIDQILTASPPAAGAAPARRVGLSRQGRPLFGFDFGRGPLPVSLIAGCHADEPVGPAMLERLAAYLAGLPAGAPELRDARWKIVPRANPDGDAANAPWAVPLPAAKSGYDLAAYLAGAVREPPGADVEFGFPRALTDTTARPEDRAIAAFLAEEGPYRLHATFHGMAFAAGPWFLIEEGWIDRTAAMREDLRRTVRRLGYRPHDVDRRGEKGFTRIDEGFTTRPDSGAMRRFFEARGEPQTAALFRPSSMEYVRSLGGDPLTLVSEMPLFLYPEGPNEETEPPLPREPESARRFVAWAHRVLREGGAASLARQAGALGLRPMPVGDQMRLQLAFLEAGLRALATG